MATDDTRESALRGLHAYKERLMLEIEHKQVDLRAVERSIELLSGAGSQTAQRDNNKTHFITNVAAPSKYAGLKNQVAAKLFLEENPKRYWKASEVAKELLRRGMEPSSKHWGPAITGALNRLAEKGIAEKRQLMGVYKYRLKAETEPEQ